jgi:hypothetical protein
MNLSASPEKQKKKKTGRGACVRALALRALWATRLVKDVDRGALSIRGLNEVTRSAETCRCGD